MPFVAAGPLEFPKLKGADATLGGTAPLPRPRPLPLMNLILTPGTMAAFERTISVKTESGVTFIC